MDPRRFDAWTRSLFGIRSRRDTVQLLVGGIGGGLLSLLRRREVAAECAKPGESCKTRTCCRSARCQDNRCVRTCPEERQCGADDCCTPCEACIGGLCSALKPTCGECEKPDCNSATGEYDCVNICTGKGVCCRDKCIDACKDCKGRKKKCLGQTGYDCVNLDTDPKHCSECGNECKPCETCKEGACVATCKSCQKCQDGTCVDDCDATKCEKCDLVTETCTACDPSECVWSNDGTHVCCSDDNGWPKACAIRLLADGNYHKTVCCPDGKFCVANEHCCTDALRGYCVSSSPECTCLACGDFDPPGVCLD